MNKLTKRRLFIAFVILFGCLAQIPGSPVGPQSNSWYGDAAEGVWMNDISGSCKNLYDSLKLHGLGLTREAYEYALQGLDNLVRSGEGIKSGLLSIADFSCPSTSKRLFILDLDHRILLFNTYVAHGQGSGGVFARRFSNEPSSYQSSLGFYQTAGTYTGKHGYSLRLEGLEAGINNNASDRAIVLHGAPYVSESFIRSQGILGRSQGCPAIPEKMNRKIIDKIKNGTCFFIYGRDKNYLRESPILNS